MTTNRCSNCGSVCFLSREEEAELIEGILLRRKAGFLEDLVCGNCGYPAERVGRQKLPLPSWSDPTGEELADRERDEEQSAEVVVR